MIRPHARPHRPSTIMPNYRPLRSSMLVDAAYPNLDCAVTYSHLITFRSSLSAPTLLPWAQGVGRSNRPAPTKSPLLSATFCDSAHLPRVQCHGRKNRRRRALASKQWNLASVNVTYEGVYSAAGSAQPQSQAVGKGSMNRTRALMRRHRI